MSQACEIQTWQASRPLIILADQSVGSCNTRFGEAFPLESIGVRARMRLRNCHNFHDFRQLAKRRLPGPIFDYIDGAAEDEATHRRNTKAFESCDLVPHVLRGVEKVDLSVTVMGQKLALPVYCSPTALQRLFHHQGERAVAAAAAEYGTMFGVSSLGTVSLEELRKAHDTPQIYILGQLWRTVPVVRSDAARFGLPFRRLATDDDIPIFDSHHRAR